MVLAYSRVLYLEFTAGRQWMDTIANARLHGETRRVPAEAFKEERPLPHYPHYGAQ
jgi:hypothetical protein